MKKAFTLIELLVVIGIIAVLAGVLMGTFSGGTESARAARCLTNMRNLAAACQSYGMATGEYPCAGSLELFGLDTSGGYNQTKEYYGEKPGWISWNSKSIYKTRPTSSQANASWNVSCYEQNEETRVYCMTNGALWKYVSGNHGTFLCPTHTKKMAHLKPNWSYAMNAYFYWTAKPGTTVYDSMNAGVGYGELSRADRILLFAELPFSGIVVEAPTDGEGTDCILQYKDAADTSLRECIGFNHKVGKNTYANIVYADGHVEKLLYPKGGMSESELQDLTSWLCYPYERSGSGTEAFDVIFDGQSYKKSR